MNISGLCLALEPEVYLFRSSSRDESFHECGKAHLLQQSLLTSMKPDFFNNRLIWRIMTEFVFTLSAICSEARWSYDGYHETAADF